MACKPTDNSVYRRPSVAAISPVRQTHWQGNPPACQYAYMQIESMYPTEKGIPRFAVVSPFFQTCIVHPCPTNHRVCRLLGTPYPKTANQKLVAVFRVNVPLQIKPIPLQVFMIRHMVHGILVHPAIGEHRTPATLVIHKAGNQHTLKTKRFAVTQTIR